MGRNSSALPSTVKSCHDPDAPEAGGGEFLDREDVWWSRMCSEPIFRLLGADTSAALARSCWAALEQCRLRGPNPFWDHAKRSWEGWRDIDDPPPSAQGVAFRGLHWRGWERPGTWDGDVRNEARTRGLPSGLASRLACEPGGL
ncbi:hypothetical protein NDU88_008439 [Pleurodeles waltl]|uniref:Uncharacterized protein n=1 Tax=Pleurodeles waltl TaxID=8319 RepID=A0AAV7PUD6_PLEWA|nr:hypothetical protein NDU88_008439 [Pleurodeles waltl]